LAGNDVDSDQMMALFDSSFSSPFRSQKETKKLAMIHAEFIVIRWMEEILHQLIGSLSHCFRVSYIPGGAGFLPSTV